MATRLSSRTIDGHAAWCEWIAMEHYRLHMVEAWPEGPYKDATLAAIHSALAGLLQDGTAVRPPECVICWNRGRARVVVEFPSRSRPPARTNLAA